MAENNLKFANGKWCGKRKVDSWGEWLKNLLASTLKTDGTKVRVLRDHYDQLFCNFYRDTRMESMFDKYPELILILRCNV